MEPKRYDSLLICANQRKRTVTVNSEGHSGIVRMDTLGGDASTLSHSNETESNYENGFWFCSLIYVRFHVHLQPEQNNKPAAAQESPCP